MVFYGINDQVFFTFFLKSLVEFLEEKYDMERGEVL